MIIFFSGDDKCGVVASNPEAVFGVGAQFMLTYFLNRDRVGPKPRLRAYLKERVKLGVHR